MWPLRRDEFIREHWQRKPLHVPGTPERLPHVAALLFDFDLPRILAAADESRTIVQPPLPLQRSPGQRLPNPTADVQTFLRLHAEGNQLYVATSEVPGMREWIERLSQDVGRLWSAGQGDVYATRAGGGADLHFDRNDNFTIQLQGRKVWTFSSERYYELPLHNSGERDGLPYDPAFAFDPSRIDPAQLEQVVLSPGDMFYMPRGFLHGTRADEDSLSLNLSLGAQPWCDVILEGLRAQLIRDPAWRETAMRDAPTAEDRVRALQRIVGEVLGRDLLGAPAGASAPVPRGEALRRNPLAWWTCSAADDEGCVTLEVRTPDRRATVLEVSREFLAILDAIPDGPSVVTPRELLRRFAHDAEAGHELVDELVSAGLLAWVHATHG